MNDEQIVKHMIDFVEQKEREAQTAKLSSNRGKTNNVIVQAIIKELDSNLDEEGGDED